MTKQPDRAAAQPRDAPSPWRSSWRDLIPVVESLVAPEVRFAIVNVAVPPGAAFAEWPPPEFVVEAGWWISNFRGFGDGSALWHLNRTGEGSLVPVGGVSAIEEALDVLSRVAIRRFHDSIDSLSAIKRWCALLLADSPEARTITFGCATTDGRSVPVTIRIVGNAVEATLGVIARLATDEAPVATRRPHYSERVRRVWRYLDSQSGRRTLDEIATDVGMGKSTVHAAIETLRADGVIVDRTDGTQEVEPFD